MGRSRNHEWFGSVPRAYCYARSESSSDRSLLVTLYRSRSDARWVFHDNIYVESSLYGLVESNQNVTERYRLLIVVYQTHNIGMYINILCMVLVYSVFYILRMYSSSS